MSPELSSSLASVLPASTKFRIYHIVTEPTTTSALFSPLPGSEQEPTQCVKHLLSITSAIAEGVRDEVITFAVEIFIYSTAHLTTIFVSKADSTGYLSLARVPKGTPSVIRSVTTAFLQHLIDTESRDQRIILSLFARSQNQYLFPGSIEVSGKHVLDDRQLIKWWCRTADPILRTFKNSEDQDVDLDTHTLTSSAYLVVPGCDEYETRSFFPPSTRIDPPGKPRWHATHPLYLMAGVEDPKSAPPPRCLVPRFPDDPKSRFLDDLDDEIRLADSMDVGNEGRWKSIRTLEQFWEMMSYRQECSAGRLVGFLWVLLEPQKVAIEAEKATNGTTHRNIDGTTDPDAAPLPNTAHPLTPAASFQDIAPATPYPEIDHLPSHLVSPSSSPAANGQVGERIDVKPSPKSGYIFSVSPTAMTSESKTFSTPSPVSSPLLVSYAAYESIISHLLSLDFSTLPLAIESTRSFISFTSSKAGLPEEARWQGQEVIGTMPPSTPSTSTRTDTTTPAVTSSHSNPILINMLTGITRKKRKATTSTPPTDAAGKSNPSPNSDDHPEPVLSDLQSSTGTDPSIKSTQSQQPPPEITMLNPGLIRKKKKT